MKLLVRISAVDGPLGQKLWTIYYIKSKLHNLPIAEFASFSLDQNYPD